MDLISLTYVMDLMNLIILTTWITLTALTGVSGIAARKKAGTLSNQRPGRLSLGANFALSWCAPNAYQSQSMSKASGLDSDAVWLIIAAIEGQMHFG